MNYFRIRIDKDTLIPVPTRTSGTGEGELYLFFKQEFDPNEKGMPLGGEMAEAIRAWISGSKVYPVSDNGVLNIYGHLVDGVMAEKALGQFPIRDYEFLSDPRDFPLAQASNKMGSPIIEPGIKTPSAVPTIDINKVIKGINERK